MQARWFGLIDLILALASGIILMLWPGLGYWPILLALLPWAARLAAGRFPFKRTSFDLPLTLFLVTAGVGVWAAYDREGALLKFWIIVSAILVFYALAGQLFDNLESIAWLLSLLGVMLSAYFLLSFDWHSQPEDLGSIEQIASIWMGIRPDLRLLSPLPNVVGGILAMVLPISVVPVLLGWQSRQFNKFALSLAAAGFILFGLFMTSSRGAWLALLAASGFWLVWKGTGILSRYRRVPRLRILSIVLVLFILGILFTLSFYPHAVLAALDKLPGLPSGGSRLDLAGSTLHLISDFPWTGGGLGSFGGLYSQYIKVTPYFIYAYSHNFYLDMALEQGVMAALLGLGIFVSAGWLFLDNLEIGEKNPIIHSLAAAGFTSLLAVLLHGLMDDALYGMSGTPFLFLLPGMAVALAANNNTAQDPAHFAESVGRMPSQSAQKLGAWAFIVSLLVIVSFSMFLIGRSLQASWYANQGAVRLARLELADWPVDKWNANPDISAFDPAVELFERSLSIDPGGATAHHRLGLIASQGRDFEMAQYHLEKASLRNPDHRGVIKVLGYVYVWNGQPEKATFLLKEIPEADKEMRQYAIWWKKLGRQDLALKAKEMQTKLFELKGTILQTSTSQQ